jgi:dethiobiotin synthetase
MAKRYFITAIGTDSGKTVVSSIITQALQADYWKPIQSGQPRDTDTVMTLVHNQKSVFHREAYLLSIPLSPHAAARLEEIEIHIANILLPDTENTLIIEGAGGVLVPINDEHFVIDLVPRLDAEVILVANIYLGSINHTLLTIRELERRKLRVKGIIFNGPENKESERIILQHSGYRQLLRVHQEKAITPEVINRYALKLVESKALEA